MNDPTIVSPTPAVSAVPTPAQPVSAPQPNAPVIDYKAKIAEAKAAGYSNKEIIEHLTAKDPSLRRQKLQVILMKTSLATSYLLKKARSWITLSRWLKLLVLLQLRPSVRVLAL
jgi:hypothetical protein